MTLLADWGSSGWKGVNATAASRPGWEQAGYDDSSWANVTLPIGSGPSEAPCPIHLNYPRVTHWPINSEFLLRRAFGSGIEIRFVVDNAVSMWWNGVQIMAEQSGYLGTCPERDEWGPLYTNGNPGVLAIRCRDTGVESYGDFQIFGTSVGFQIGRVGVGPGVGVR